SHVRDVCVCLPSLLTVFHHPPLLRPPLSPLFPYTTLFRSSVISTSNQCRYLSPLAVLERISCQVSSETCISAVILPLPGLMNWASTPTSQTRYSLPSP